MHFVSCAEATTKMQLWGEGGDRQVAGDPEVAVAAAGGGPLAGALLLTSTTAASRQVPTSSESRFWLSPGAERVDVTV